MPLVNSFRQLSNQPGELLRRAEHDGVTYVVRVRRHGVEPSGCILGFPIWAWTRLRWQTEGTREWSVETTKMRSSGIYGKRIAIERFPARADALRFAEEELGRLRSPPQS